MRRTTPVAALLLAAAGTAMAQAPLRDPMQPLPARRAATPATAAARTGEPAAEPEAPLPVVRHVLIAGDRRYVVDQGRLRGVGDLLGGLRIERIDEAAVTVRRGSTLHRLPLFASVAKQAPAAAAPSSSAPAPRPPRQGNAR